MRTRTDKILRIVKIICNISMVTGIAFFISLFFSRTIPLWRILIPFILIFGGIIIKVVISWFITIFSGVKYVIKNPDALPSAIEKKLLTPLNPNLQF